ncbi:photosynthetic NDH subunit of lumenal location 4, chloroplastic isoform X2 [Macadamia integrifolia]|uniref:photosynthetic NDH subunit of lumenal location 4, chloroplastic isoform X2 n=1 Tax=Macadamia integrifolia TaxID=60698 RepID=UPI001C4F64AA|nr:photosynthetic NDH subunit of lumenal location 4, chloroplastic isoform X2 [Macadamia integrifolia]XP_042517931.1 photosynthetic NDH subunit of lumenal location 4, chloroplastic isoform X2 [Macadamia integrifolia]XP_042517932.1 photosynthetic NDH subunit of lumenal location 4, chloroplastic isoform X2 [Macadamia integrifolia]
MAVSTLTVATVQTPHLLHTFKPNMSPSTFRSNSSSSSSSYYYIRSELSQDLKGSSKRRFSDLGLGLLAASLVISSPLDANATRIEYFATVSEPSCDLNFVQSGLGFCDVAVGTGNEAPYGELINIHYTARFADGIVFDSSYKRARPLTMRIGVGKVLRGLDQGIGGGEGVPPMLVGGKRKLQIPPELAYGPEPAGCFSGDCNIPGNATLVYDINFVGIYK